VILLFVDGSDVVVAVAIVVAIVVAVVVAEFSSSGASW
jgi:hypothetical protein